MVTLGATSWAPLAQSQTVLERLDPPTRAAVLMAVIGLVLLGLALVVLTMIGGRWLRRVARDRPATQAIESKKKAYRASTSQPVARSNGLTGDTAPGEDSSSETTA
ncbi:hypothetical protein Mal64_20700 [Pseudobythopirellula maris]|uniref:Uncharacterized protein n=1 Tax=Pseudobythopirellula maris TaxID=2527991 RepID=A0A5C5ZNA5_9BACT|nr:hypothetical protein [Pseudobythopirellula maris]TWT88586.1 hypothetical protein Mal64_20700 [Pseudobythopirellula maris]